MHLVPSTVPLTRHLTGEESKKNCDFVPFSFYRNETTDEKITSIGPQTIKLIFGKLNTNCAGEEFVIHATVENMQALGSYFRRICEQVVEKFSSTNKIETIYIQLEKSPFYFLDTSAKKESDELRRLSYNSQIKIFNFLLCYLEKDKKNKITELFEREDWDSLCLLNEYIDIKDLIQMAIKIMAEKRLIIPAHLLQLYHLRDHGTNIGNSLAIAYKSITFYQYATTRSTKHLIPYHQFASSLKSNQSDFSLYPGWRGNLEVFNALDKYVLELKAKDKCKSAFSPPLTYSFTNQESLSLTYFPTLIRLDQGRSFFIGESIHHIFMHELLKNLQITEIILDFSQFFDKNERYHLYPLDYILNKLSSNLQLLSTLNRDLNHVNFIIKGVKNFNIECTQNLKPLFLSIMNNVKSITFEDFSLHRLMSKNKLDSYEMKTTLEFLAKNFTCQDQELHLTFTYLTDRIDFRCQMKKEEDNPSCKITIEYSEPHFNLIQLDWLSQLLYSPISSIPKTFVLVPLLVDEKLKPWQVQEFKKWNENVSSCVNLHSNWVPRLEIKNLQINELFIHDFRSIQKSNNFIISINDDQINHQNLSRLVERNNKNIFAKHELFLLKQKFNAIINYSLIRKNQFQMTLSINLENDLEPIHLLLQQLKRIENSHHIYFSSICIQNASEEPSTFFSNMFDCLQLISESLSPTSEHKIKRTFTIDKLDFSLFNPEDLSREFYESFLQVIHNFSSVTIRGFELPHPDLIQTFYDLYKNHLQIDLLTKLDLSLLIYNELTLSNPLIKNHNWIIDTDLVQTLEINEIVSGRDIHIKMQPFEVESTLSDSSSPPKSTLQLRSKERKTAVKTMEMKEQNNVPLPSYADV